MIRSFLGFVVLVVVVAYGFGIWLFLLHPQDRLPPRADAVFVLAGSKKRLPVALTLMRGRLAKTLVVSADDPGNDPARYALCHSAKPRGYKVVCEVATPSSTRGEARLIAALARKNHWLSIAVVTSRYHIFRAHLLIRRCTKVNLAMRATDGDRWWQKALAIPLEYAKLVRAEITQRGC